MVDFQQRIKTLKAEVEALKTASRSAPDGMTTITKTINTSARLVVYAGYVGCSYFIKLIPENSESMIFSVSQNNVVVSDDVIIASAVPHLKNGNIGVKIAPQINYQRQQYYLDNYSTGDVITKNVSIKITASDNFTYTVEED